MTQEMVCIQVGRDVRRGQRQSPVRLIFGRSRKYIVYGVEGFDARWRVKVEARQ
jgi:hypothetical protein